MSNSSIFQNPKSGSIKVTGSFEIVDEQGNVKETVTDPKLCGCGLSQEKPFCDKSHAQYVKVVSEALTKARNLVKPITPFGTWSLRANEIRNRTLEYRIAVGEKLLGVKFGGALLKGNSEAKNYGPIFGFLTDVMQIDSTLELSTLIIPVAEAEVVFKLSQELSGEITLDQVHDYVSKVAPGIEIFDSRYGITNPFIDDAVADNACAGAFAVGKWRDAKDVNFEGCEISIYEDESLNQKVPASSIAGNPWAAVVNVSKLLAAAGVKLPAGSIIFSGSATSGIAMKPGKYRVVIDDLGEVSFLAS